MLKVNLTWSHVSTDLTGFRVERRLAVSGAWLVIANLLGTARTYDDADVTSGVTYDYRVSAINQGGVGPSVGVNNVLVKFPLPTAPTDLIAVVSSS
jgi:hypothetical protein